MDTTLRVDVVSGVATPWPRIETDHPWMTTGSAKPLEDAFRIAHTQMVRWLEDQLDLSAMDAYQLVAQVALTPVADDCDTVYTVVCKVPKAFFPGIVAMHGVHDDTLGRSSVRWIPAGGPVGGAFDVAFTHGEQWRSE